MPPRRRPARTAVQPGERPSPSPVDRWADAGRRRDSQKARRTPAIARRRGGNRRACLPAENGRPTVSHEEGHCPAIPHDPARGRRRARKAPPRRRSWRWTRPTPGAPRRPQLLPEAPSPKEATLDARPSRVGDTEREIAHPIVVASPPRPRMSRSLVSPRFPPQRARAARKALQRSRPESRSYAVLIRPAKGRPSEHKAREGGSGAPDPPFGYARGAAGISCPRVPRSSTLSVRYHPGKPSGTATSDRGGNLSSRDKNHRPLIAR
ncbi:hypothetical protein DFJ69_0944 [Thermomonospora umbrina]|uniref:Uncharacterized protein n=1 Tax=Thermomonospora umbrina TaxID=111806 RepID=A0A3D9SSF4_9ACTN|nr:hypothetical protein DFJ69_0944 [Thermomonospora umbrina]